MPFEWAIIKEETLYLGIAFSFNLIKSKPFDPILQQVAIEHFGWNWTEFIGLFEGSSTFASTGLEYSRSPGNNFALLFTTRSSFVRRISSTSL
ncbi:hypothetical protein SLA2020_416670 [Shorea laevis]